MNQKELDRITKVEVRLDMMEKCLGEVKKDTKEILTNHLPHISNQITALTVKVAVGAFVASLLASAAVGWIFNR